MQTTQKFDTLHPTKFQLILAQSQCPYNLPVELKKQNCQLHSVSWFSSLLRHKSQKFLHGHSEYFSIIGKDVNSDRENLRETKENCVLQNLNCEISSFTQTAVGASLVLSSVDDIEENKVIHQANFANTNNDDKQFTADSSERSSICVASEEEKNKIEDVEKTSTAFFHDIKKDVTLVKSDSCDAATWHCINTVETKPRDVAVGTDDCYNENYMVNILEPLLASTVERIYTKLEENLLKVAALDEMKQQLSEVMHCKKKHGVKEEGDKVKLAIYLYSLRRKVEILKQVWKKHEMALLTMKKGQAEEKNVHKKEPRVEIIRDYEKTPEPYKKKPFVSLASVLRRSRSFVKERNTSFSSFQNVTSSFTTSSQSTFFTKSANVSNSLPYSSETVYSSNFE